MTNLMDSTEGFVFFISDAFSGIFLFVFFFFLELCPVTSKDQNGRKLFHLF